MFCDQLLSDINKQVKHLVKHRYCNVHENVKQEGKLGVLVYNQMSMKTWKSGCVKPVILPSLLQSHIYFIAVVNHLIFRLFIWDEIAIKDTFAARCLILKQDFVKNI